MDLSATASLPRYGASEEQARPARPRAPARARARAPAAPASSAPELAAARLRRPPLPAAKRNGDKVWKWHKTREGQKKSGWIRGPDW